MEWTTAECGRCRGGGRIRREVAGNSKMQALCFKREIYTDLSILGH